MMTFKERSPFISRELMAPNVYLRMCACHVLDCVLCPLLLSLLLLLQRQLLSRCVLHGLHFLIRLLCRRYTRHALHWHNQRLSINVPRFLAKDDLSKL